MFYVLLVQASAASSSRRVFLTQSRDDVACCRCSFGNAHADRELCQCLSQVAHQEEVVNILRKALETANLPHLLFYGPPGTGKTTTALAMARQLYGCASARDQPIGKTYFMKFHSTTRSFVPLPSSTPDV